jgi:pyruvate formate lyase activating enzyme
VPEAGGLRLGGFTPLSTADFPGRLAAVLFCQGCPWSCVYCHNPHLISAAAPTRWSWLSVVDFLGRRSGMLDAVVFSGGEPTLQDGLADAMCEVRSMGFQVGLHTAGPYPERLARVLPLVDWVGFDVKAPFERYGGITRVPGSGENARESLRLLVESGVDHECRTTLHPALFSAAEAAALSDSLFALGVRRHVLQAFRTGGCLDAALGAVDEASVERLLSEAAALAPRAQRRG